jgi:antitoxin CptB
MPQQVDHARSSRLGEQLGQALAYALQRAQRTEQREQHLRAHASGQPSAVCMPPADSRSASRYIHAQQFDPGMQEDLDLRRKRLRYRSLHRGTKELDLILGGFATRHLDALHEGQLAQYEAIIESDEHRLYRWLCGAEMVPPEIDGPVMRQLLDFKLWQR